MKKIILIFLVLSISTPGICFMSSGNIPGAEGVYYSGLNVYRSSKYSTKVTGYIENNNDHKIYLSASVIFQRTTGVRINQARLVVSVRPNAKTYFEKYLSKHDNYQETKEALSVEWVVSRFTANKKKVRNEPTTRQVSIHVPSPTDSDSASDRYDSAPIISDQDAAYQIILTNGKKITAEQYWEQGDEIIIERYGAKVFYDKARIKTINGKPLVDQ